MEFTGIFIFGLCVGAFIGSVLSQGGPAPKWVIITFLVAALWAGLMLL